MQLHSRLVHADTSVRVVAVSAREGERLLGTALGEAAGAEEAEERAIARLLARLGRAPGDGAAGPTAVAEPPSAAPEPAELQPAEPEPAAPEPAAQEPAAAQSPVAEPPGAEPPGAEPPADPDDWSTELAQIELQLRRIGWNRDAEAIYLQRAFGHPSRSRLTTYADLLAYLRGLEALVPQADPAAAPVPLRRADLLAQCQQLLDQLGWGPERGRAFLEQQLGAASRQQLNDNQLLQFNILLEGELIAGASPA